MKGITYIRVITLFLMILLVCLRGPQAALLAYFIGLCIVGLISLLIGLKKKDKLWVVLEAVSIILSLLVIIVLAKGNFI
mgnify:CR=1 FL=1